MLPRSSACTGSCITPRTPSLITFAGSKILLVTRRCSISLQTFRQVDSIFGPNTTCVIAKLLARRGELRSCHCMSRGRIFLKIIYKKRIKEP